MTGNWRPSISRDLRIAFSDFIQNGRRPTYANKDVLKKFKHSLSRRILSNKYRYYHKRSRLQETRLCNLAPPGQRVGGTHFNCRPPRNEAAGQKANSPRLTNPPPQSRHPGEPGPPPARRRRRRRCCHDFLRRSAGYRGFPRASPDRCRSCGNGCRAPGCGP
jgi:hypothetical protein